MLTVGPHSQGLAPAPVGWQREGAQAETAAPLLEQIGFDLSEAPVGSPEAAQQMEHDDERLAFCLAEHLTGMKLTPEALSELSFTCGEVSTLG